LLPRERDQHFMRLALAEAEKALASGDVPIGAVIVRGDEVIGHGFNRREADQDPTAHAEMIALRMASAHVGRWRIDNATLYCTLEPCAMCAGAVVLARLPRLVFAAPEPKTGAAGSVMDIVRHPALNHTVEVVRGVLAEEASAQLQTFFKGLRAKD
jgi:tRNA(adenine34) deaminase